MPAIMPVASRLLAAYAQARVEGEAAGDDAKKSRAAKERMDALVRTMASSGAYDPDDGGRIELLPVRKTIGTTGEAASLLRQAVVWFDDQAVAHKSKSGMEALYLGAYEQVSRISALLACWGGVREAEHVRWAFETVRRDVQAKALAVTANEESEELRWVPLAEVSGFELHPGFAASLSNVLERAMVHTEPHD